MPYVDRRTLPWSETRKAAARENLQKRKASRTHFGFKIGDRVRVKNDHMYTAYRGRPGTVVDIPSMPKNRAGRTPWIKVKLDDSDHPMQWHHGSFELIDDAGQSSLEEK